MASIDQFEDHCWRDVIPKEDLLTYADYARETKIGENPALLAIDLYNLAYKGVPNHRMNLSQNFLVHAASMPTKPLNRPNVCWTPLEQLACPFSTVPEPTLEREFNRHGGQPLTSPNTTIRSTMLSPRGPTTFLFAKKGPALFLERHSSPSCKERK